jgi:predicted transcriptional regulator
MDGVAMDRIVGFEELGGRDDFPTLMLIRRLVEACVIKALNDKERGTMKIKKNLRSRGMKDEDDSESDHSSDDN